MNISMKSASFLWLFYAWAAVIHKHSVLLNIWLTFCPCRMYNKDALHHACMSDLIILSPISSKNSC